MPTRSECSQNECEARGKRIAELEAAIRHATKIEDALRELVDAYKSNDGRGDANERVDLAVRMAELIMRTR